MSKDYEVARKFDFSFGISYSPNLSPEDVEFTVLQNADIYDLILSMVNVYQASVREKRKIEFISIRFSNPASAGAGEAGDVSLAS